MEQKFFESEHVLDDDYPIYGGYAYIADGGSLSVRVS
jgi:hypothetical protein